MNIKLVTDPIHYLYIEDLYDDYELEKIWIELDYYQSLDNSPFEETSSAIVNGERLKRNSGFDIDQCRYSNLFYYSEKIFDIINVQKDSWFFTNLHRLRYDGLLSYYDDGGYYKPHYDEAIVTAVTWFHKDPKSYTGGNFNFTDFDISFESKSNSCVIFPSQINHHVDPVLGECKKGHGRYCYTQFLHH